MSSYFISDLLKQRDRAGRSANSRIHNEMDESISNRSKKCSLRRTKRHNHSNYSYN